MPLITVNSIMPSDFVKWREFVTVTAIFDILFKKFILCVFFVNVKDVFMCLYRLYNKTVRRN